MANKPERILRVGIIQGGRIVEERLLRKREVVTIGWSPKNTFVVPVSNLPRSYKLFEVRGKGYALNFREGTKGRVSLDGGVMDLADARKQGKARRKGDSYQIDLSDKARGKLVLGEVTLLFQLVIPPPLPPKLKLPATARGGWIKSIEWHFVALCFVSAFLQVVPTAFIVLQDWPAPKRTSAIPDRFVSLIVKEQPKPEEEDTPEDLPSDEEGDQKVEDEPKEKPKEKVAKAAPKKQDPEAAARAAAKRKRQLAKAVRGKTLLKFITAKAGAGEGGAPGLVDALGHGAARSRVDEAFAGATGVATASAGMDRSRRGGAASAGSGELATIKDLKASGATKTVKGGRKRRERRVANIKVAGSGPSKTFGTGKLDRSQIARRVKRRLRAIKSCYERELKKNPSLKGKVVVQFTIGTMGRITSSKVASSTMGSPAVGRCILGRMRNWRFPKPTGGSVTVSYPFVFTASQ